MADQRQNWRAFQCRKDQMESIAFGPDRILVAPPTRDAWTALANVLLAHSYELRTPDTDSYNCREIKDGGAISLHSFGIALDINWNTNPYQKTPDRRKVRFSGKPTQAERAEDVRLHRADTDMTPEMIADILAIRTNSGRQVFEWGGNWNTIKDTMHFEIAVSPADLASGIDQGTVRQPAPDATWATTPRGALAGADSELAEGAEGPRVRALQASLASRGFAVGEIDGDFGPQTLAALKAFQAAQGLPVTGIGDPVTLVALGLAAAAPPEPLPQPQPQPVPLPHVDTNTAPLIDQLIKTPGAADLDLLLRKLASPVTPPSPPALPPNVAAALVAVLLGKAPATAPATAAPDVQALKEAVMSPVDKALGGELLTGKKTALAVVAYAVMSVLQGTGVAPVVDGAPATTGESTVQILYTLIMAFGGLGLVGKADRVVNLLGLLAAGARARRPG